MDITDLNKINLWYNGIYSDLLLKVDAGVMNVMQTMVALRVWCGCETDVRRV